MQRRIIGTALLALALVSGAGASAAAPAKAGPANATAPVDVNSATRAQLTTLPGIGDAQADRIIAGRPYLTKAELVTRKAIPAGTFLSIKGRIIAVQPAPAKPGRSQQRG